MKKQNNKSKSEIVNNIIENIIPPIHFLIQMFASWKTTIFVYFSSSIAKNIQKKRQLRAFKYLSALVVDTLLDIICNQSTKGSICVLH